LRIFATEVQYYYSQYGIPGPISALPWRSGKVDVEGEAATYGFGTDLRTNLHATGSFRGRAIELGAAEAWDTATGCFEWAWSPRNSRLKTQPTGAHVRGRDLAR
jgi:hypothetical protein